MKDYRYSVWQGIRIYENEVDATRRSGLPLVCIHGMWGFALMFHFWFALGEKFGIKMYAIELPGHNKDNGCLGLDNQSIENYVATVDDAIRTQIGNCMLLGWSMGARISERVAEHNEYVKKVVLVAGPPQPGIPFHGKLLSRMLKYTSTLFTGKSFRLKEDDARVLAFNVGFSEAELSGFISELNPESGRIVQYITLMQFAFWRNFRKKTSFRCPMLIVGAEHDALTPVRFQLKTAARYMGSKYTQIAGASHAIMLQPNIRDEAFQIITNWTHGEPAQLATAA